MDVNFVGAVKNLLDELWRDEIDAFAVADGEISRHYSHAPDTHRNIDSSEHDVIDGGGVGGSKIGGHVDFREAIQIANAAVDNQSAAVRGFHHVVEEIVSDDVPFTFLPKRSTTSTSPGWSISMAI